MAATGASCILVPRATPNKMTADCVMERKKKPEDDKVTGVISVNRLLTIWWIWYDNMVIKIYWLPLKLLERFPAWKKNTYEKKYMKGKNNLDFFFKLKKKNKQIKTLFYSFCYSIFLARTWQPSKGPYRNINGVNNYHEIIDAWYVFHTNCGLVINDMDHNMDLN